MVPASPPCLGRTHADLPVPRSFSYFFRLVFGLELEPVEEEDLRPRFFTALLSYLRFQFGALSLFQPDFLQRDVRCRPPRVPFFPVLHEIALLLLKAPRISPPFSPFSSAVLSSRKPFQAMRSTEDFSSRNFTGRASGYFHFSARARGPPSAFSRLKIAIVLW